MSGTTVTIPSGNPVTPITLTFGNAQNAALAKSIAGTLHDAAFSVNGGNGLFIANVTAEGGDGSPRTTAPSLRRS